MSTRLILAVVEGGGTTFQVAVVATDPTTHLHQSTSTTTTILHRLDNIDSTTHPHQTLQICADFFRLHKPIQGYYDALGIATFGPVGLQKGTKEYGCILNSSPKAVWRGVDLLTPLIEACQGPNSRPLPVQIDTDVNAPALAEYYYDMEHRKPTGAPLSSVSYVTVGTGVGVGLVVNGKTVHGKMHPEGGHIPIRPLPNDNFPGYSWGKDRAPFGGIHTVEGVTSSVALTERLQYMQQSSSSSSVLLSRSILADLDDDHEIWDHAANALACLCATLLLMLSMEKIVLGGGIMQRPGLLDKVRTRTLVLLNGYLDLPNDLSSLIVASVFGTNAGLVGAVVLAQQAYASSTTASLDTSGTKEDEKTTLLKRQAFGHGLWHGILIGSIGAGLVCKYCFMGRRDNRR